jgi:PKD repeat protein
MAIDPIPKPNKNIYMKKNLFYIILILFAVISLTGCKKYELGNPLPSTVSDFSYTIDNDGYAPATVTFTNKSLNATGYQWDFGNGKTSTETNPVMYYETPGLYTVTLTCTPVNEVHYNKLVKTLAVNVKDPLAGLTKVLYFTTRGADGGGIHMVILNDEAPIVQDFETVELSRPYGIAIDTSNNKVFVSDYSLGYIYRFNPDGKNPVRILDVNVAGQEIVEQPEALMVVGDKLYWGRTGGIYRCNFDGSNPEVFLQTSVDIAPEWPVDMQYDEATGLIYLVNDRTDYSGGYFSLNIDGTNLQELVLDIDGTAIEVDTETHKTYMAVYGADGTVITENGIYMCNNDGTALSKIADFGTKATWGMTMDTELKKLFWAYKISNSAPDGKIVRANMDGTGQEDFITGVSPHAMQVVWIKL